MRIVITFNCLCKIAGNVIIPVFKASIVLCHIPVMVFDIWTAAIIGGHCCSTEMY